MAAIHRFRPAFLALMALTLTGPQIALSDVVPRYRLQVGQQFLFHCDKDINLSATESEKLHADWKVDVVAQNTDGSWQLLGLVDSGGTFHNGTMNVPVERVVEVVQCDLYPDGTVKGDDDPLVNLPRLFPRLPADANQMTSGWDDQTPDHARITHFEAAVGARSDQVFSFTATARGGIVGVFEPGSRQTYEIDRHTGLVDDIQLASDPHDQARTEKGEILRTATDQLQDSVIQKLVLNANSYDQALNNYKAAVASTSIPGGDSTLKSSQAELDQAGKALVAAVFTDAAPHPPDLQDAANAMVPDPPSPADILDKAAPDWMAKTAEGTTHSLKEFRGKVVLLDFGSRGCSWCIREIPQLIRLSQTFKDKPVVIIGMDLDSDPVDVNFVVNAMKAPYLTVMAADVSSGYPIEGTPTVVIIDQNGIMRRRFIGYSMLGYDEFKAAVESLLPDEAASVETWNPPPDLEFLRTVPELRGIDIHIREQDFQQMIKARALHVQVEHDQDRMSYWVATKSGYRVVVMFQNGVCSGIQRLPGT